MHMSMISLQYKKTSHTDILKPMTSLATDPALVPSDNLLDKVADDSEGIMRNIYG